MFEAVKISPSILSADFMNMERDVRGIAQAGADWVHVDVMDGHFVPNLTLGVPFVKHLRMVSPLPLDVHLMIDNPLEQLPWFCACHPDYVTVHWEAFDDAHPNDDARKALATIHESGARAGIALKPDTPVDVLAETLASWDMVLIMSVYPGFSGQSFIPAAGERVAQLTALCRAAGCAPLIQVDGGINCDTAAAVCGAGADVLVAGNAVFGAEDRADAITAIRAAGADAQEGGCHA